MMGDAQLHFRITGLCGGDIHDRFAGRSSQRFGMGALAGTGTTDDQCACHALVSGAKIRAVAAGQDEK
ncbi:hypothetical protein D3C81_2125190 [compost metagenome]